METSISAIMTREEGGGRERATRSFYYIFIPINPARLIPWLIAAPRLSSFAYESGFRSKILKFTRPPIRTPDGRIYMRGFVDGVSLIRASALWDITSEILDDHGSNEQTRLR
jgi:hypothetical protein